MMEVQEKGEIESDGQRVRVYMPSGTTHFGPLSVQYGSITNPDQFFPHGTEAEAVKNWDIFVGKMAAVGVTIGDKHRPTWLPHTWTDIWDMLDDIKRHVNQTGAGVISADHPPMVGFVSLEHHQRKWEITPGHLKKSLDRTPVPVHALGIDFRTGRGRAYWASNQRKPPPV